MILEGADARDRTQMRMNQAMAWATAQLVMTGFHDPKKFPKFDKMFPDPEARRTVRDPDEIWVEMERWAAVAQMIEEQKMKGVH